jgi:hypothetical protein
MKRLAVFAAVLMLPAVCAAAPQMTPGLWEMTSTFEGAGMPQSVPPTKFQHCYRPEDVKDMRNTVPEKNPNCKISDWKESGKTVTWKTSCTGKDAMTGSGSITYAGDSYTGVNTMTMSHGGQAMTMTQKYNARRLGDCR